MSAPEYVVGMSAQTIACIKDAIRAQGGERDGPPTVTGKSSVDNKTVTYWLQNDTLWCRHPTKGDRRCEAVDDMIRNNQIGSSSTKGRLINCLVNFFKVPVSYAIGVCTGPVLEACYDLDAKRASGEYDWEGYKTRLSALTLVAVEMIDDSAGTNYADNVGPTRR